MHPRIQRYLRCLVAAFAGFLLCSLAYGQQVYRFGVVPQFEARKLADIWVPILERLEAETGLRFEMVGSPRIPEFEVSFTHGEFDFAYMNPYHSVVAADQQGYVPLIRDGGRELFGILVVHKDSPVEQVSDLKDARVAFPAPNALGASLLMRADLTDLHGIDFTPVYTSTHTSSYLNTVLGETDAAGGVMGTFKNVKPEIRQNLRIIYETRKMPPHPITAHPRVPLEVQEKVRQAFLAIGASEAGQALLARVPMLEPVSTNAEDFSVLRQWGLEKFYVESGG